MKKDSAKEKEKQRKLSPAEEKRLKRFEETCAELERQGYVKKELTVGIVKANVVTMLLAIPICAVCVLLFHLVNPGRSYALDFTGLIVWLVSMFALTVVHEGVHGLTWSRFSPNGFGDIDFGFMKEYLTPYCTCAKPLSRGAYIAGALMPLIVLGILPWIVSILCGSVLLLYIALTMILAAGGDMLIVLELLKHPARTAEQLIYDHPTQAGCVVFER